MLVLSGPAPFALGDAIFAQAIMETCRSHERPALVGLAGPPGSGRREMASRIAERLADFGMRTLVLALDDFSLAGPARARLAARIHPLLLAPGLPGTHDTLLLEGTIGAAVAAGPRTRTVIPAFDATRDRRAEPEQWRCFTGRPDVILLEGWCIGAQPETPEQLALPANDAELAQDPHGFGRAHVNAALAIDYAPVFRRLDLKLMLRPTSFEYVRMWCRERADAGGDAGGAASLAGCERVIRRMCADLPFDIVADVDAARTPVGWQVLSDRLAHAPAGHPEASPMPVPAVACGRVEARITM